MNTEIILINIFRLLKEKDRKQKELADFLGLNESAVANWKSGTTKSYKKYVHEIADFFDVPVNELLGDSIESSKDNELERARKAYELRVSTQNSAVFPTEIQMMYNALSLRAKLEVQTFIIDKSEEEKGKKS